MKLSFRTLFVIATLIVVTSATESYGCSCVTPQVGRAYNQSRAVFIGVVTDIVEPVTNDPKATPIERLFQVKFKVGVSWKGSMSRELTILSDQGRAGCFSWASFVKGQSYLVYADAPPKGSPRGVLAVLLVCNRTALVGNASEDVKELEALYRRNFRFNN